MEKSTTDSKREKYTKVSELKPQMKNINIVFIVLEKGTVTKTKDENIIAHALVADATGCINLSLWDTQAEWLNPGDIIRLRGGYCSLFKGKLILYSGRYGSLKRIGDFCMVFVESPNMSLMQWVQDPNNPREMVMVNPQATGQLV